MWPFSDLDSNRALVRSPMERGTTRIPPVRVTPATRAPPPRPAKPDPLRSIGGSALNSDYQLLRNQSSS